MGDLFKAIREHDITTASQLSEANPAWANAKDLAGAPPLNYAAANGDEKMVDLLLSKGANVDGRNVQHQTALHWAAHKGHEPVLRRLLAANPDTSLTNSTGETALDVANRSIASNKTIITGQI